MGEEDLDIQPPKNFFTPIIITERDFNSSQNEELAPFLQKALDSLTKFKKEFKNDHNFLYGTTKGYFKNLKDQIENCRSKKVNVFLFGWKKSGKSSIIKLLCNIDEKDIKTGFNEETITIQPYEFEDVRFIDTIGLTEKKFKKCFDKLSGALKIYPPDLVIWVVNAHDWVGHKESLIGVQKIFWIFWKTIKILTSWYFLRKLIKF